MVEARICKKVGLDECNVKLKLSYIPLLVGSDEKFVICDDEDLCGYLLSLDKDNRRCILVVEAIKKTELSEQLSRAGKRSSRAGKRSSRAGKQNSVGTNYEVCHSNDDEIGDKAITRYGGKNQVDKQYEQKIVAIEEMLEKNDEELNVDENVTVNSKAHHNYSKAHQNQLHLYCMMIIHGRWNLLFY